MRNVTRKLIALVAVVPVATGAWWATRVGDDTSPPHALWRNSVIIHVRGCEHPGDETTLLTCAGLYCAKSVTLMLTNAQQAELSVTVRERDGGAIRIAGSIDQYLNARTLPTGFECNMRHYRRAVPKLFVAGQR